MKSRIEEAVNALGYVRQKTEEIIASYINFRKKTSPNPDDFLADGDRLDARFKTIQKATKHVKGALSDIERIYKDASQSKLSGDSEAVLSFQAEVKKNLDELGSLSEDLKNRDRSKDRFKVLFSSGVASELQREQKYAGELQSIVRQKKQNIEKNMAFCKNHKHTSYGTSLLFGVKQSTRDKEIKDYGDVTANEVLPLRLPLKKTTP